MNIFLLLLLLCVSSVEGQQCYSCAGACHSEHCNCQMGACPSSQCFIERAPTEEPGVYRITKGCLQRSSRTTSGCDYDRFNDHVLCVCSGPFCNDHIFMRFLQRRNVTCRKCTERDPDCDDTCMGQWCHEDTATGITGCGFGPPSLPFFYKGTELLYLKNKLCVTMSRGMNAPRRHCICNTSKCNNMNRPRLSDSILKSRSLVASSSDRTLPLYECVSCDVTTAQDTAITASCKSHRCIGHFCTLVTRQVMPVGSAAGNGRPITNFPTISEQQGCINVSDTSHLQLGCSRKWMANAFEEVLCACQGNLCNRDIATAGTYRLLPYLQLCSLSLVYYFMT